MSVPSSSSNFLFNRPRTTLSMVAKIIVSADMAILYENAMVYWGAAVSVSYIRKMYRISRSRSEHTRV